MAPDLAADEVGARVVAPDPEHEQEHPAALGTEPRQRRGVRDRRCGGRHLEHERDQAHVQRAEHRREPRDQPVTGIRPEQGADPGQHDPDRDQHEALVAGRVNGGLEHERDRERRPEQGHRRVPGRTQQPEHLEPAQAGDHHQDGRQGRDPEQQGDQQGRDKDERGERAGPEHGSRLAPEPAVAAGELEQGRIEARRARSRATGHRSNTSSA